MNLLLELLQLNQFRVWPILTLEFRMRAVLLDVTVVDDKNLIGVLNGGETMCDHDAGAVVHQGLERVLDGFF